MIQFVVNARVDYEELSQTIVKPLGKVVVLVEFIFH